MYASLNVSPRKKRAPSSDDEHVTSPKKLRTNSLASSSKSSSARTASSPFLPSHLARIQTIHSSLRHALSLALATSAVSPCTDTGRVPNVLNHLSLSTATGFTVSCDVDDIRRLCWLWEWDGANLPLSSTTSKHKIGIDDDDNPFIVPQAPVDWTRGGMGFILTPTTHLVKAEGKRQPAYGIGIEVEMDLAEGKRGGMAAVARWTAEGESRRQELEHKLRTWVKLHSKDQVPQLPFADLPVLSIQKKLSPLTKLLAGKSPQQRYPATVRGTPKEFALLSTPPTPIASPERSNNEVMGSHIPQTPARQRSSGESGVPQTPTTSRRAALYERIRQKSLTCTPSSSRDNGAGSSPVSADKLRLLGQEELRRRCLLGRLDEVAATVWALFSSPAQTSSTPLSVARKRRTMQTDEVVRAIMSSASIPISTSDAQESIALLTNLCPFFLRPLVIGGEEWMEMPASNPHSTATPPSPRHRETSGNQILNRSPKTVKTESGGLREVRERIRRELEVQD